MSSDKWRGIAEERIRQAQEEGAFDDLPGAGKPLLLPEENPYEGACRSAFQILKDNNLAPRWIEIDGELRREVRRLRRELRQAYKRSGGDGLVWQRAVASFLERVERLNEMVRQRNHLAPRGVRPRFPLRVARELRLVRGAGEG